MKTFDIVIPCYNEEKSLEKTIERIIPLREKCKSDYAIDLNIIIVDDASTDKSLAIA